MISGESLLRIARFGIAGSTALGANLGVVYVLLHILGIYYLWASVGGFLAGFVVSFTLQKFWTFRDRSLDGVHRQASIYFFVAVVNLGINTALVRFFVESMQWSPLFAQTIAALIIASVSFFVYQRIIFRQRTILPSNSENL